MVEAQKLPPEQLWTPSEVAAMFAVEPKTVAQWARDGKLTAIHTPAGNVRYSAGEVQRLRSESITEATWDRRYASGAPS